MVIGCYGRLWKPSISTIGKPSISTMLIFHGELTMKSMDWSVTAGLRWSQGPSSKLEWITPRLTFFEDQNEKVTDCKLVSCCVCLFQWCIIFVITITTMFYCFLLLWLCMIQHDYTNTRSFSALFDFHFLPFSNPKRCRHPFSNARWRNSKRPSVLVSWVGTQDFAGPLFPGPSRPSTSENLSLKTSHRFDDDAMMVSKKKLVGGLVAINFIFPYWLGLLSSSQLTNSIIFQRGGPSTNQETYSQDIWTCPAVIGSPKGCSLNMLRGQHPFRFWIWKGHWRVQVFK